MRSPIAQAVLLVGGEGTRLRPLTYQRPKATIPLLNQPLLSYELTLFARHGVTDIVLAVGYRAEALRQVFGDGAAWGVRLTYVEDPRPLGTAGAIRNVAPHLRGPFFAINGDLVYDVDLASAARAHLDSGAAVTFCLRRVHDIRRFGLVQCDESGRVRAFLEKQEVDHTGQNTVNSGLYVMSPRVLDHIPPGQPYSNEYELFPALLKRGERLLGHMPARQGYWADVGTLEAYLATTHDLLAGALPWVGPGIAQTAEIAQGAQISGPVRLGEGVRVDARAQVGPNVVAGPGCIIKKGAEVREAILWEGVTVSEGAVVRGSVLGDGVTVDAGQVYEGQMLVR